MKLTPTQSRMVQRATAGAVYILLAVIAGSAVAVIVALALEVGS